MELFVSLAPVEDCTDPFFVGAELGVSLHLHVIHLFNPKNFERTVKVIQAAPGAVAPDLTHLSSLVYSVQPHHLDEPLDSPLLDSARTKLTVSQPVPIKLSFRNLQAGPWSIPTKVGEPVHAIGVLQAMDVEGDQAVKAKVLEVHSLELNPRSSAFGTYVPVESWQEGEVDVSNIAILQAVIAKIKI